jgi:hypothetical protein
LSFESPTKELLMKKILPAIAAVFLLLPVTGFAAYVIHLKDGTQFVTDQYYEEGDQIKFKRYGGVIGIEKALVRDIEEVEDLPEEKQVRVEPGGPTAGGEAEKKEKSEEGTAEALAPKQKGGNGVEKGAEKGEEKPAGVSEKEKKEAEQDKAAKMQAFLDEKRQILRKMEAATSAFKEAKAAKNNEKKNKYWNELLSLQKKFAELRDRAEAEHGGEIPQWWDSE